MNTFRTLPAVALAAILAATAAGAAEIDRHLLRSVGTVSESDAQVRTVVTAARGTNSHPAVSVTWRARDVTDSASKPMTRAGWFVFVEQPSRVWIFDGEALSVLERGDKSVSDSSSPEVFKTCPKPVRDALPGKIQKRYFN